MGLLKGVCPGDKCNIIDVANAEFVLLWIGNADQRGVVDEVEND
jgi:hypothetical protein